MSSVHRLKRLAALSGLVCAAFMTTIAGVAVAASDPPKPHPQERYLASYGDGGTAAALAREAYLESYGETQPLSSPQAPAAPDDSPWLPIALSITGALVIVAASASQLRRLRIRRRRAAGLPA
jgi:hypothetical protein